MSKLGYFQKKTQTVSILNANATREYANDLWYKDNLFINPQEGKIIHAQKLPREQNQQT